MTIREAKGILNRAGYRILEEDDDNVELRKRLFKQSYPGSLYDGISNTLMLMYGVIDDNDPNSQEIRDAIQDLDSLVYKRIKNSDIPGPIENWPF